MRQLALAISYLHNKLILHRDLKLDNIVLDKNHERVVIVDFGLSNFWTEGLKQGTHCGSPEYAAPELFDEFKPYGTGVDVWSLGIMMYGMVLGTLPFSLLEDSKVSYRQVMGDIKRGLTNKHREKMSFLSTGNFLYLFSSR